MAKQTNGRLLTLLGLLAALGASTVLTAAERASIEVAPEGDYVLIPVPGGVTCRQPTDAEAGVFQRNQAEYLHQIASDRNPSIRAAGLKIILRATAQLENQPQAKQLFLRAAQFWESQIASPVTIVVDVDYGTTRFGTPYPENVLGSTGAQNLGNKDTGYSFARSKLSSLQGRGDVVMGLYSSLPTSPLPSDKEPVSAFFSASAVLRAIGWLPPTADPALEGNYGNPPSIGFNSKFAFDLDPDNGIDTDKIDFLSVATHELGHVLGFNSSSGDTELDTTQSPRVTSLDLFRLKASEGPTAFATAKRQLSSGGDPVFWAGAAETKLSTGRNDATGGDLRQPGHWKDNALTGMYIGVMDPTLGNGDSLPVTQVDLAAIEAIGWQVNGCAADETTLCLGPGGRFKVQAEYRDYGGNRGQGKVRKLTDLSGYFYFFDASNVELVVKFVSFCNGSAGNWAIYASGLTDIEITFKVLDTKTGLYKEYRNALGDSFCTIGDGPYACPVEWGDAPAISETSIPESSPASFEGEAQRPNAGPVIEDARTAKSEAGPNCAKPEAASTFTPTDLAVFTYHLQRGMQVGETTTVKWFDPAGSLYQTTNFYPVPAAGTYCSSAQLKLAGTSAASKPGSWRVQAFSSAYGNQTLVDLAFTVSGVSGCISDPTTLCLGPGGRFKVQADYKDHGGNVGQGKVSKLTDLSGYLYFFESSNVELVAKFVSGCTGNSGNWGLYASGLTDVEVTFKVTDTKTGFYKEYKNPLGTRFCTIRDGPYACP